MDELREIVDACLRHRIPTAAIKRALDPDQRFNPGKVLAEEAVCGRPGVNRRPPVRRRVVNTSHGRTPP